MKTYINLLPWRCRRNQLVRARLVQWSTVWAVTGVATLGVVLLALAGHRADTAEVEELEAEYAPIETLKAEVESLRSRVAQLGQQEAVLADLVNPRPALTLMGLVSRSVEQCEGRVRIEQLSLCPVQEPTAAAPKENEKEPQGKKTPAASPVAGASHVAILKGIAADNLAAARFVLALRRTEAFDRVELKSSVEQPTGSEKACAYVIECAY